MSLPPVVTFSSIDWDYVWQGHQEVMSRLASAGHPVLFVENTGLRRLRLSDWSRVWKRAGALTKHGGRVRRPVNGLELLSPKVLPFPYSPAAVALNARLLEPSIRRWLGRHGGQPIAWTYLPTPLVLNLVERLQPSLFVYYCVDDLPASSNLARRVEVSEAQVFERADLVLVTSEALRRKALRYRSEVHVMPSGVDYERFEAARSSGGAAPAEIAGIGRPVVGYVGTLHRWFDVALAAEVARRLPDVRFVFIGPMLVGLDALRVLPNVHLLGARPHDEIPMVLRDLDVAVIPYVLDSYTASVFPTKLNEYLAMGLPVVSTPIAEVVAFRDRHGPVVETAGTAQDFAAAIGRAIGTSTPAARAERMEVARSQGWAERVAEMRRLIASTLEAKAAGGGKTSR